MSTQSTRHQRGPNQPEPAPMRFSVLLVVMGGLLVVAGLIAWTYLNRSSEAGSPENAMATQDSTEAVSQSQEPTSKDRDSRDSREASSPNAASRQAQGTKTQPQAPASKPLAGPTGPVNPLMSGYVTGLQQLSGTNVVLTAEALSAWRTNFAQLIQGGAEAVPALRAFLAQNTDAQFSQEALQALGYGSTRLAALDALRQIGGPEAIAVMQEMLGPTLSPKEIAVLAYNLDQLNEGQSREQALAAARDALHAAGLAKNPEVDVAALFEVFQKYGGAAIIPELENAMGQWKYYAAMTLVNLPDGAGIPSLLRMADPASTSGNRLIALETVAQLSGDNPEARNFLLQQAQAGQIPSRYWAYLTGPLAGDEYYPVNSVLTQYPEIHSWSEVKTTRIPYGNQNLYMLPGTRTLTPEGVNQRVAFVNELLKSVTDPAGQEALQRSLAMLGQRTARVTPPTNP